MLTVNTLLCPHVAAMHAKYTRVCKEIERLTQNTTKEMPVYFVKAQFYSTNSRICIHCLRFCHDTLRLLCSTISGRFMSRSLFSARRIGKACEHTDVRAKLSLNNVLRTHNIGFQLSNIFIYTAISSTLLQANDTSSRHYLYPQCIATQSPTCT